MAGDTSRTLTPSPESAIRCFAGLSLSRRGGALWGSPGSGPREIQRGERNLTAARGCAQAFPKRHIGRLIAVNIGTAR